jgi:hypothetical protein
MPADLSRIAALLWHFAARASKFHAVAGSNLSVGWGQID